MSRELKRQLNQLKHSEVKPSAEWVAKNRSLLLSQIKNTVSKKQRVPMSVRMEAVFSILMPETIVSGSVRFVAIALIAALVAPSLYYGTAMASSEALPGDNLYGAKRYAEKIQVAVVGLLGDTTSETKLHVELAKKRAEETSKIISDPAKISNVASTVADLKSEMTTVSDKLEQNSQGLSADTAKDIKQNTDQIKQVLESAKNDLITVSPADDKTLTEVKNTKDLVQDVAVKAVEVLVTKHLEGDTSVTKDEVKATIDSTVKSVVGDVATSKENIAGVQTVLQTAKTDVATLTTEMKDPNTASTTKEITEKIATVYDKANQAVQVTDTISAETTRKAAEVEKLLGNDNLTQAVDRLKELSQASKDVEVISDKTITQAQPLIPIVQVVKDVLSSGVTSSIDIVSSMDIISSSMEMLTTTSIVVTSTINTTSLKTLPLPKLPAPSSTAPTSSPTSTRPNTSTH